MRQEKVVSQIEVLLAQKRYKQLI